MKKSLKLFLGAALLTSSLAHAELQAMSDAEMGAEAICGLTGASINVNGKMIQLNQNAACELAASMDLVRFQDSTESQAQIDARMAQANDMIARAALHAVKNAAIAKQDQASLDLQKSLLGQSYDGNRRTISLNFIGQLQGISFGQIDGSTKKFTRIIDDGCTGSSICFHTETRSIDTSKVDRGILKLQIK